MDLTDSNLSIPSPLSEIIEFNCMQLSLNQQYIYFGGDLKSNNARKSCPILAFSTASGKHEGEIADDLVNIKRQLKLRTPGGSQLY